MDNLKRIREPLTWALLGVAALSMVLTAANLVLYLDWVEEESYLFSFSGVRLIPYPLVAILVLAVWGCAVEPAIRRVRPLALTAVVLVSIATVVTLLQTLTAFGMPEPVEVFAVLDDVAPDLLIGVLGVVALGALARPGTVADRAPAEGQPGDGLPEDAEPTPEPPASVWGRTEASGAVWRTADEAASGAPGSPSLPAGPPDEDSIWRAPS